MIKELFNKFKNFEEITYKIMKNGFRFCFVICMISILFLATYNLSLADPNAYYIGLTLFRLSLIFAIEFIICGLAIDTIKKQMI